MSSKYNSHTRPSFLRNFLIAIVIIVLLILVFLFILGVLSVVNNVSPLELLKGKGSATETTIAENVPGIPGDSDTDINVPTTINQGAENLQAEKPQLDEKRPTENLALQKFNDEIAKLVEETIPSVVNLRIKVAYQSGLVGEGVGSGIIYSENGYIITNNHVVGGASEIIVRTYDEKEYVAKLVGANKDTDIAVVKIDAKNLKKASFTSIKNVKVGEIVIAIGSPFAIEQTVTFGVVSAKGREIAVSSDTLPMVDLIQTDAAINPGNSGGPLINIAGQVVGVNTLIYSPSGGSAGIGFAIPSDTAVNIANQIIQFGRARIPYLGVEMGNNTTDIPGVLISSVQPDYPASKAGIRAGDILTKFDGEEVNSNFELLAQILRHNVGDTVPVEIYRNGSYMTLTITLVESPATAGR